MVWNLLSANEEMPLKVKSVSLNLSKMIHMLIYASLSANFKEYLLVKNVFLNEILKNVNLWLYNMQITSVERTSARSASTLQILTGASLKHLQMSFEAGYDEIYVGLS